MVVSSLKKNQTVMDLVLLVYFVCGLASVISAIIVLFTYGLVKELRSKTSMRIVFCVGLCDLFFSLKFFMTYIFGEGGLSNPYICFLEGNILATLGQFWGVAGVCWNAAMSYNLILTLRNPFSNKGKMLTIYHLICWTYAFASTAIIVSTKQWGDSHDGSCWIKGDRNHLQWLFIGPVILSVTLGCASLAYTGYTLIFGAEFSSYCKYRKGHVMRTAGFVTILLLTWSPVMAFRIGQQVTDHASDVLEFLAGIGVSSQGIANAILWLFHPSVRSYFRRKTSTNKRFTELEAPLLKYEEQVDSFLRYDMMHSILSGISEAAFQTEELEDHSISLIDYLSKDEYVYKTHFKFVDYAAKVFRQIRRQNNITTETYLQSFRIAQLDEKMNEKFSEGKSGSFFWISEDNHFMIKTMSHAESVFLRRIVPQYFHFMKLNPKSYLVRFYGIHSIRFHGEKIFFVVMNNVFDTKNPIHKRYDIKGSWINRTAAELPNKTFLGMDMNLTSNLQMPASKAQEFLSQIEKDVKFLQEQEIMDYSLLIGICEKSKINGKDIEQDLNGIHSMEESYYLGIIDVLQEFTLNKRMERFTKVHLLRKDGEGISAVEPNLFAQRFIRKMHAIVDRNKEV